MYLDSMANFFSVVLPANSAICARASTSTMPKIITAGQKPEANMGSTRSGLLVWDNCP